MSAREREVFEIVDAKTLFHFLADRNIHQQALLDAALAEAEFLIKGGVTVPGVKSEIKKVMV